MNIDETLWEISGHSKDLVTIMARESAGTGLKPRPRHIIELKNSMQEQGYVLHEQRENMLIFERGAA